MGDSIDKIKNALKANFVGGIIAEERSIEGNSKQSLTIGDNLRILISETSKEDPLMESEVLSNVEVTPHT